MGRTGLICALLLLFPAAASAEWQFKPFLGVTFGTNSTFVDLEQAYPEGGPGEKNVSMGVSGAWLGNIVGFEADLGIQPGFFERGEQENILSSGVTTFTGNVVLTLPRRLTRYVPRPYFVGGAGLMRVNIEPQLFDELRVSQTMPALDVGGGVTGFLSSYVGVSWDVRYFRSLGGSDGSGVAFGRERLSFWRAIMAVAIRTNRNVP